MDEGTSKYAMPEDSKARLPMSSTNWVGSTYAILYIRKNILLPNSPVGQTGESLPSSTSSIYETPITE